MPLWFAYLSQSCWLSSIMFLTGTSIFSSWWLSVFLLASCMLWKPWSSTCPPVWFLRHWNPVNPSLMQFYSGMSVMKLSPFKVCELSQSLLQKAVEFPPCHRCPALFPEQWLSYGQIWLSCPLCESFDWAEWSSHFKNVHHSGVSWLLFFRALQAYL